MLLKERAGVYKGKITIKTFLTLDIDIDVVITEDGNITTATVAPIVGKISHSIALGADYDKDDYDMEFGSDVFHIKFNSNTSISIELPEKINGSFIVTRNVTLERV
ncbi:hypothetical protein [uncultured Brachyspira sp.]|uniref:hypothetical protein n=1 Tax=uncultured Brachyspira sp. TaxID=221953 RepID=UPI0026318CD1|nr:hypothetical protein [uncultured Brachyspira sp.]